MVVKDIAEARRRVERLLDEEHTYPTGDFTHVIEPFLAERDELLALAVRHPTPFYLLDRPRLRGALTDFAQAFGATITGHRPFYAIKSNPHPGVVAEAVAQGFGLDVSSGRELRQALAFPGCPILFSGPAKSDDDLSLAVAHADRVTIQLDSFRELERLGRITQTAGQPARAGVRIFTEEHGAWSKFGIPLGDLASFWSAARSYPRVQLVGVQFHLSWNRSAAPYERIIAELGAYLASEFTAEQRTAVAFVDVGGGYKPHQLEGYFPKDHPLGALFQAADDHLGEAPAFLHHAYRKESIPLAAYARAIGAAIDRHLRPLLPRAVYCSEPGRIVSTPAMHLVLRVVDRKRPDMVIVDGGINMVGWERYLHIYCPVLDLTHPARTELSVRLGGSLCDCEDVWGDRCFASSVEEGDVLIVPYQGAYTFTTAQEFIRPIPPVHERLDP